MPATPGGRKRHGTGAALSILAFGTALTLSGCSIPGLPGPTGAPEPNRPAAIAPVSATTPTPNPASTLAVAKAPVARNAAPAAPVWKPVRGDLASGSKTHRLGAAAHTLVIDYWTTEDPASWTPDSSPIISLNARIDGAPTGEAIKVTRFNARVDALGAVLANDTGSFAIDPPYAYSSGVVVPANPKATSTKIVFTIDLLTETVPGTGIFTRQTILDSLTIGYPKPGAVAAAAVKQGGASTAQGVKP
ncbi:hypothetical protein [Arthrobacter globiformis]|uniref:Uncharacterized protein n=1 Tax=Arthrobacter globiformis TaxID=1665 RepID=A0A328HF77_ARTGO|nr:hypothetical protein [Arthrobacter globiformis]RAM37306.1 hypothetical protein DBZ45_10860 [Arthrobacter globiformis]